MEIDDTSKLTLFSLTTLFIFLDFLLFGTIMMFAWLAIFDWLILQQELIFTKQENLILLFTSVLFGIEILISYFLRERLMDPGRRIMIVSLFALLQVFFIITTYVFYFI